MNSGIVSVKSLTFSCLSTPIHIPPPIQFYVPLLFGPLL